MFLKSLPPLVGGGDIGARLTLDEGLVDGNVSGFFQFTQMSAEVSIGDLQQVTQVEEVHLVALLQCRQGCHNAQAYRLMDGLIQLSHSLPPQVDIQTEGDHSFGGIRGVSLRQNKHGTVHNPCKLTNLEMEHATKKCVTQVVLMVGRHQGWIS